jgi:hypothetical protein
MRCTLTSVWDSGRQIVTQGTYDLATRKVESLETVDVDDDFDVLVNEFVTFPDGETVPVCLTCHEYVIPEGYQCPECENQT